jgi:hypothetical protein
LSEFTQPVAAALTPAIPGFERDDLRSRGSYVSDGSGLAPGDTFDRIDGPGPVDGHRFGQKTRHMMSQGSLHDLFKIVR